MTSALADSAHADVGGMAVVPQPGDFAVVPVAGAGGLAIGLAECAAGYWRRPSLARYRHAFIYLGPVSAAAAEASQLHHFGWSGPGVYCAEAMPGGARLRRLGATPAEAVSSYGDRALWSTGRLSLHVGQRQQVRAAALGALGTPYSVLDYLALILYHLRIPFPRVRRRIASAGHMICSQFVDMCWQRANVRLFSDGRWDGDVMPADLAAVLSGVPVAKGRESAGSREGSSDEPGSSVVLA
jgi:hypothetical protein